MSPISSFESGLGKWGYIDQTGRLIVPPKFIHSNAFSNGLALVDAGVDLGEAVFIDKAGKVRITPKQVFGSLPDGHRQGWFTASFHEGLAVVEDHQNGINYPKNGS